MVQQLAFLPGVIYCSKNKAYLYECCWIKRFIIPFAYHKYVKFLLHIVGLYLAV